jgi:hypothetical protein
MQITAKKATPHQSCCTPKGRVSVAKITMKTILIHTLYIGLLATLLYVNFLQANTVIRQQQIIRDMVTNPYCLIPEVK